MATDSLTIKAYRQIRKELLNGTIAPGEHLHIDTLCQRLDFGRSAVREALSTLSSEQLVERMDQRGFRAAGASVEDFEILVDTRVDVEKLAIADAIKLGGSAWEEQIVLMEYRLANLSRQQHVQWEETHRGLHMALLAACRSPYLKTFCAQLYDLAIRYRNIASGLAYPQRRVDDEHKAIVRATLDRDAETAAALLEEHYRTTARYLSKQLVTLT